MLFWTVTVLMLAGAHAAGNALETKIWEVLTRPTYYNASVAVQIRRLGTGEILFAHNDHLSLLPASNQKLITAALALGTLGSDFRYKTPVLATVAPDANGILHGDLYLQGSGDPSLTSDRLATMAKELADLGVKKITGNIVGDGSRFDDKIYGEGWAWDDEAYDYGAQIAALSCDRNVVNVSVTPGESAGSSPFITINGHDWRSEPYVEVVSTVNTTVMGDGGSNNVTFDKARARNTILLSGTIPVGSEAAESQVPIEDPPVFTAYLFAKALRNAGVHVSTEAVPARKAPASATGLHSTTSEPLSHLLLQFLKQSDNLYGELFFKTIGYTIRPDQPGSAFNAGMALNLFLGKMGIQYRGIDVVDGSGLSRYNTATVNFYCDLLELIGTRFPPTDHDSFLNALPSSGSPGTIEDRFPAEMAGKVQAKTGSLTRVSSLSGYLTGKNGEMYCFSILMNQGRGKYGGYTEDDPEVTKGQDDIIKALYYW